MKETGLRALPRPVAVVVGGGGVLGAAHVGVGYALEQRGFVPDMIVGTSVGDLREVSQRIPTVVVPTGIDDWPAPWDFRHSQRLISTAAGTAGRFLDRLQVSGPGLYRADERPRTGLDRETLVSAGAEAGR